MRHCYVRFLMGLIWLAAAVVSGVRGNISMTAMYGVLSVVFIYTAYNVWKKEKTDRR